MCVLFKGFPVHQLEGRRCLSLCLTHLQDMCGGYNVNNMGGAEAVIVSVSTSS